MRKILASFICGIIGLVSFNMFGPAKPASAATCYAGFTYSGYVLHKSYGSIYIWNPNTGCENWLYIGATKAYYCNPYEWFNGSSCPTPGGGGGGSW